MDPTRPLDSKRSPTAPGARAVGSGKATTPAAPTAGAATTAEVAQASAIVSTQGGGAIEVARAETARIDGSRLDELGERIERGHYDVDPSALAERILDDAFGHEVPG